MWRTRRCPGSGCPTIESSPTDSSPSPLTRWQVPKIVALHSFGPFLSALWHGPLSRELRVDPANTQGGYSSKLGGKLLYTLNSWQKTVVKACCFYINFTCGKKKCWSCISGWGGGPGRISMPGCHQFRWSAAITLDIDEVDSNFNKNWNNVNLAWCTWYVGSNHWPWNLEFQSRVDRRR